MIIADKEYRDRAFILDLRIMMISHRHRVAHVVRPNVRALCGLALRLPVYASTDVPLCLKCKAALDSETLKAKFEAAWNELEEDLDEICGS
jgi:hypothetical protein